MPFSLSINNSLAPIPEALVLSITTFEYYRCVLSKPHKFPDIEVLVFTLTIVYGVGVCCQTTAFAKTGTGNIIDYHTEIKLLIGIYPITCFSHLFSSLIKIKLTFLYFRTTSPLADADNHKLRRLYRGYPDKHDETSVIYICLAHCRAVAPNKEC